MKFGKIAGSRLERSLRPWRCLGFAESDPGLGQIVGGQLDGHAVAGHDPDEVFPHLSGDVREHDVTVGELHAEHRPGEHVHHYTFACDAIVFWHADALLPNSRPEINPSHEGGEILSRIGVPGERCVLHPADR